MLNLCDFVWKKHYENNILTNPMGCYYCIIDCGTHARRYSIVPQYPSTDGVSVNRSVSPEYYILFESTGHKATEIEKSQSFYDMCHYDDYVFEGDTFIRVFTSLDEAKRRAYTQYKAIYGYVLSNVVKDIEESTKHHFSVL